MSAELIVTDIISNALAVASEKSAAAQAFSQEAVAAIDEAGFGLSNPPVFSGGPTKPTFEGDLTDDPSVAFKSGVDADVAATTAKMAGIFSDFLDTYFPNIGSATDAAIAWLENAITNGGTGIKASIENQIWERSRARELKEADRLAAEATSSFAKRGFSMPPGAMAAALREHLLLPL